MIRLALLITATATIARADPCNAIPDKGPMPSYLAPGKVFSGPVVHTIDGDGFCVDAGSSPGILANWIEVRVADFYAPELNQPGGREAKATLASLTVGRRVVCIAGRRSWDRVVATCVLDGLSVGARLRRAGVAEGGRR